VKYGVNTLKVAGAMAGGEIAAAVAPDCEIVQVYGARELVEVRPVIPIGTGMVMQHCTIVATFK
jgi:hypothetical protein